jgi:predicted nucleic acid-binding protein
VSGFLLDTNIMSELGRSRPDARVAGWMNEQSTPTLFVSVVSLGELRRGSALLPEGAHRSRLEKWFEADVLLWFGDRILPVTREIADR